MDTYRAVAVALRLAQLVEQLASIDMLKRLLARDAAFKDGLATCIVVNTSKDMDWASQTVLRFLKFERQSRPAMLASNMDAWQPACGPCLSAFLARLHPLL